MDFKRVTELIKQVDSEWPFGDDLSTSELGDFADLIVKQCIGVIEAQRPLLGSGIPDYVLVDMIIKNIREYMK